MKEFIRELLNNINRELGDTEIVCEVSNRYWVDKMKSALMKWKLRRQ
jgi:hypothetical protein